MIDAVRFIVATLRFVRWRQVPVRVVRAVEGGVARRRQFLQRRRAGIRFVVSIV
jgi:hypothetical protein